MNILNDDSYKPCDNLDQAWRESLYSQVCYSIFSHFFAAPFQVSGDLLLSLEQVSR
jgi:hypothetical protein